MTSRWSSWVTLRGAAAAGPPAASTRLRAKAISGLFMRFLPVFRISRPAELDRRGCPKFPRRVPGWRSAADSYDDAGLRGERGGFSSRLPSPETGELTRELRVRLA